jgi:hypothetical protein
MREKRKSNILRCSAEGSAPILFAEGGFGDPNGDPIGDPIGDPNSDLIGTDRARR